MSNSTIQKVVLVGGSGHLGPFILAALQAANYDLTVVTRRDSTAKFPQNTKVVKIDDGYPEDQVLEAFAGADAVVLSLAFVALEYHAALVDASIKAGVKRLVASTYGCNDENAAVLDLFPIAYRHHNIVNDLRSRKAPGWSWTSISCGPFFEMCVETGFFGLNAQDHTAILCDDASDFKFSTTTRATIGTAVARVLAKPEETANRNIFISSFEVTMNEVFNSMKKATGVSDWTVTSTSTDELVVSGREMWARGDMYGMAKLALVSQLREEYGSNFRKLGKLDNDLLGIETEDVDVVVAEALKDVPK
ncbi:hypothetical protein TWF694_003642 [Orbilia ellipsospora]|uniref:NmrA-like domain-containing protein n=1 Tax=Orbilia ellipsospora TaxID=2528407 RepID=A0AAV9WYU4_9PEZI